MERRDQRLEQYEAAIKTHPLKQLPLIVSLEPIVNSFITQIPVYKQQHQNLCGYHSFANIINFDSSEETALLCDKNVFLKTYQQLRNFVYERQTNQKAKKSIMAFGELERAQADKLMKEGRNSILHEKHVVSFIFGFGYIQNCEESLKQLQDTINDLKEGKLFRVYIILGITVHWTVLVVDRDSETKSLHAYYLDSLNYPLKYILQKNKIIGVLDSKSSDSVPSDDYLIDLRESIDIITRLCTTKNLELKDIRFQNQLREMLNNFDMTVNGGPKKGIKEWLENQYAVPVIRNDVFKPMWESSPEKLQEHNRKRFKEWCTKMREFGMDVSEAQNWLQGLQLKSS